MLSNKIAIQFITSCTETVVGGNDVASLMIALINMSELSNGRHSLAPTTDTVPIGPGS